jgi:hypothetical protein
MVSVLGAAAVSRGGAVRGSCRVDMGDAYLTGILLEMPPSASAPPPQLVAIVLVLLQALTSCLDGEEGLRVLRGRRYQVET